MRGLFIGIGGTGDEILARLKDKVYATLGEIPDTLQFRLVDTEGEELRKNKAARLGGEGSEVAISGTEYLQLQDEPPGIFYDVSTQVAHDLKSYPEMSRWYGAEIFVENLPKEDFGLVLGAGQHRQFARMGAFLNKERLNTLLRKALEFCQGGGAEVPIWIIGSVAGGTGAGLFMDLALMARCVAEGMGVRHRVIGASVLPDVFGNVGIDPARAYAVLRELERFQAPVAPGYTGRSGNKGFRFAVSYGANMDVHLSGSLFANLVFYNRRCEDENSRKSYFSEVADGLNLLLDESAGDQLFREWINVEEGYAASFNSFRVFLPAQLYRRQFVLDAALQVADGLLPWGEHGFVVGSTDERRKEANQILASGEILQLFSDLLMRKPEQPHQDLTGQDFEQLSKQMTSEYIVEYMLGFANPVGVFGKDVGESRNLAAERLHANIFAEVEAIDKVREDFEDSKKRIVAEITGRRRIYKGDGADSFSASLAIMQELIQAHIQQRIDESARRYLVQYSINEQALGRASRVFIEVQSLLAETRKNLERLVKNDRLEMQRLQQEETEALNEIKVLKKKLIGGKSQLANLEYDYLAAAADVVHWEQRERLVVFFRDMIALAIQRFSHWLDGMKGWQQTVEEIRRLSSNEKADIHQRLERQTKIRSASIGLKNTVDMDGYQEVLRDKCLRDPKTSEPYVPALLAKLTWAPGEKPQDLQLQGWPNQKGIDSKDFSKVLNDWLEENIGEQMNRFDGMANYLEWLRDVKRDRISDLAEVMKKVTEGFVDTRTTSATRNTLFLHGDTWNPDQHNQPDAFTTLFEELRRNANIPQLTHNLEGADGVNLFKDCNVIAALMGDNKIPYSEIPIIRNDMRPRYLQARSASDLPWRAYTYHLFRCDQEAWRIERDQVMETGNTEYPLIPGQYSRLLDEPERVQIFAQALATGVIRQETDTMGDAAWVCGPKNEQRKLVYLTNPGDSQDKQDLLRALATFVLDQRDRRRNQRGTLDLRTIKGWIRAKLEAENMNLQKAVAAFRNNELSLFNGSVDTQEALNQADGTGDGNEQGFTKDFFMGLILNYYLRPNNR